LERSINSLLDKATLPTDEIEFWVGADPDDQATREHALALGVGLITASERWGYGQLHRYYNLLSEAASGPWSMLWNDDAFMETPGWDQEIRNHDGDQPQVLSLSSTGYGHTLCCFPVVSRAFHRALGGRWSLSPHCDSWLQDVARATGVLVDLPVEVRHERFDLTGDHQDETFQEGRAGYASAEYNSVEMAKFRARDVQAVRRALGGRRRR
jgi:hypothetical protein